MKMLFSCWFFLFLAGCDAKVKREAQRQNCAGSQCNQNNLGGAGGAGFGGGFSGGATQNCVGSQCNQNNFGRKRREVLSEILEEARLLGERNEDEESATPERKKRQVQNCHGSNCNQNNLGGGGFGGFTAGYGAFGGGGAQIQNCHGSHCNQNNVGGGYGGLPVGG
eukprot:GFUD01040066.1.p1 GENE.GFUD01040066.1~~GFUD01040066.1.p1  ORF type:complete len:166 (+),score=27.46 GFUD01040066.1:189-686(+)